MPAPAPGVGDEIDSGYGRTQEIMAGSGAGNAGGREIP